MKTKENDMGYESKLYIVKKSKIKDGDGRRHGSVIAMFDLCKVTEISQKMRKYKATDCYFYASDGNTEVVEDAYGEPLKEIPIQHAISILRHALMSEPFPFWRYYPCLMLLESLEENDPELVVLHYGY